MKYLDQFLDSITMYRLLLYYLLFLLAAALVFSIAGILPFSPVLLIVSVLFIVGVSWITNKIFAWAFNAPTNLESVYISALILALIIAPIKSAADLPLLFWASVLTMASKYILALHKKHFFNPVAIALVITAYFINGSASWWVGTIAMLPFSLLGLLIVRKMRKYDLVVWFFGTALVTMFSFSLLQGSYLLTTLRQIISSSPIFFFASVMLTEPLTTPPTKQLQAIYGAITGILFAPQFHIGAFYTTPELALVIANLFSYGVSPKSKWMLTLKDKIQISPDMWDYIFTADAPVHFQAGQYLELTLPQEKPDSRGSRRYLTIASSPTETDLRFGIKFYLDGSSYKKQLQKMVIGDTLLAGQLAGDFLLPKNDKQKLVFLAGGIGITPFRSMVKYLDDIKQKRDIVLLYSNKNDTEAVYKDIFSTSIKTIYVTTQTQGRITADFIKQQIPDYQERKFYLSGPHGLVTTFEQNLKDLGLSKGNIVTDFFPGFA